MMIVALVLHLWHMVAPAGKFGVSSSASAEGGIAAEGAAAEAEAEALDPGVRRDDDSEVAGDFAGLAPTLEFFFTLAS